MHVALTLTFGPSNCLSIDGGKFVERQTQTDGHDFVGVHRGLRTIVLTGGEKGVLATRCSTCNALAQTLKC